MQTLLTSIEAGARPDILSLTIDSHTRLGHFDQAERALREAPAQLNGYPLVAHGAERGRALDAAVQAPLQVRHGSPDPRVLFGCSVEAGLTSFEGGGISYNLPYAKRVPLGTSLAAWREVDHACGALAASGVIVDRELFGTLTAVLVPPSLSLAISLIEAVSACEAGVKCVTIAYPQGGEVVQDVAALRAIPLLAAEYLPPDVEVFSALHEYMGPFPRRQERADELIFYGSLVARLGAATKVVTKSHHEALGIPTAEANIAGVRTSRLAQSDLLGFCRIDEDAVLEEVCWILREVEELVASVLVARDLDQAVVRAFAAGRLDVPFSASEEAHRAVMPARDGRGAIRFADAGGLPFSGAIRARDRQLLGAPPAPGQRYARTLADINHFAA